MAPTLRYAATFIMLCVDVYHSSVVAGDPAALDSAVAHPKCVPACVCMVRFINQNGSVRGLGLHAALNCMCVSANDPLPLCTATWAHYFAHRLYNLYRDPKIATPFKK